MQGQLRGSRPKLELVTVALATMAEVAADRHVHRERATTTVPRRGLVQRTTSIPLRPRSLRGLEPKQAQDLLHCDLRANSVEIDAWHDCSSGGELVEPHSMTRRLGDRKTVPFLLSLWGTGTAFSLDQSRRCQPVGVRQSRPARSSDSSASPRRSFLTPRDSRSFARVSTTP
jgi:hypothetical protein